MQDYYCMEMTLCEYDFTSATMHTAVSLININLPDDHNQDDALLLSKAKLASSKLANVKKASSKNVQSKIKNAQRM